MFCGRHCLLCWRVACAGQKPACLAPPVLPDAPSKYVSCCKSLSNFSLLFSRLTSDAIPMLGPHSHKCTRTCACCIHHRQELLRRICVYVICTLHMPWLPAFERLPFWTAGGRHQCVCAFQAVGESYLLRCEHCQGTRHRLRALSVESPRYETQVQIFVRCSGRESFANALRRVYRKGGELGLRGRLAASRDVDY